MELKNKLWFYASKEGIDDMEIGKFGFPLGTKRNGSNVSPVEGAYYLGLNNIIMDMRDGEPIPGSFAANDYLFTFAPMDNIMWPVCGSDGYRIGTEEEYLKSISGAHDNICAGFIGDAFGAYRNEKEPERTELAAELFENIRKKSDDIPLYVSCYGHDIEVLSNKIMKNIDGIILWIEDSDDIPVINEFLDKLDEKFPKHKKMIGVSLFDFKNHRPVPLQLIDFILYYGMGAIQTGRTEGMVISGNTVMGVGFETDKHVRDWILKNGSREL